jgi:hypothetical protein
MASWCFAQDRGNAALKAKPAQITAKTMPIFQQNCQNLFSFRSTHLAVNANKYEKILTWFNAPFTIILLSSLVREALRRQGLKVVFFGRTSCGKSTLINALLGEPALPTGLGIYSTTDTEQSLSNYFQTLTTYKLFVMLKGITRKRTEYNVFDVVGIGSTAHFSAGN